MRSSTTQVSWGACPPVWKRQDEKTHAKLWAFIWFMWEQLWILVKTNRQYIQHKYIFKEKPNLCMSQSYKYTHVHKLIYSLKKAYSFTYEHFYWKKHRKTHLNKKNTTHQTARCKYWNMSGFKETKTISMHHHWGNISPLTKSAKRAN